MQWAFLVVQLFKVELIFFSYTVFFPRSNTLWMTSQFNRVERKYVIIGRVGFTWKFLVFELADNVLTVAPELCSDYLILIAGSPTWLPRNLRLYLKVCEYFNVGYQNLCSGYMTLCHGSPTWLPDYDMVARPDT